jgi:hypothetical protein
MIVPGEFAAGRTSRGDWFSLPAFSTCSPDHRRHLFEDRARRSSLTGEKKKQISTYHPSDKKGAVDDPI